VIIGSKIIEVPNDIEVFVFGSVLISDSPNDLDIIIIYDNGVISSRDIYKYTSNFIENLSGVTDLFIDITYLTKSENENIDFVNLVSAISLLEFLKLYSELLITPRPRN